MSDLEVQGLQLVLLEGPRDSISRHEHSVLVESSAIGLRGGFQVNSMAGHWRLRQPQALL